jgi:hypothetical protein
MSAGFRQFLETERHQRRHDRLVEFLAAWWQHQFADVRAAHGVFGFREPEMLKVGNRIPDVTARHTEKGRLLIGEAETELGLDTAHTAEQWKDIYRSAQAEGAEFHVIVPEAAAELARAKAKEWGVQLTEVLAVPEAYLPRELAG